MLIKRIPTSEKFPLYRLFMAVGIIGLGILATTWIFSRPNESAQPIESVSTENSKEKTLPRKSAIPIDTSQFQTLAIQVDAKGIKKLQQKKREAIAKGVLESSDDDWVDGVFETNGNLVSIQLRLKGDWMDHVKGKKPSYRIKVKGENTWNRLKTFSIQRPETRHFLSEWVFHQILRNEGLLTTRYDFIQVTWNGKSLGVYAYEEHFEKQLPEYSHRREGPILKFSEAAVWQARKNDLKNDFPVGTTEGIMNSFESTHSSAFQENRILKNSLLSRQYATALQLMEGYKTGNKPVGELFDLPNAAKYYAMLDLTRAYHSIVWHNQRFYYNPILQKLEPIGFDAYTIDGPMEWIRKPFLGHSASIETGYHAQNLINRLFLDESMMRPYVQALYQFSDTNYVKRIIQSLESAIEMRQKFIQKDYSKYEYDSRWLIDQAKKIRSLIFPFGATAIQVKTESNTNQQLQLQVSNNHILPLLVIGSGSKSGGMLDSFSSPIFLPPFTQNHPPKYYPILTNKNASVLFFELPGIDSVFEAAINQSHVAQNIQKPQVKPLSREEIANHSAFIQEGNVLRFLARKKVISKSIVIPKGYQVIFDAGAEIDLINSASFISYSPVQLLGQPEIPVKIYSSDNSAQGFTVIQPDGISRLRYAIFDGLSTINTGNWQLTGAVTFYESKCEFENCSFMNAKSEDALNLVRSEFILKRCLVQGAAYDGLDVDFSKGELRDCTWKNIGNDGIDFSGSIAKIYGCEVMGIGDKGISVGEEATIEILSANIRDANIGIASKDMSKLNVRKIWLNNCKLGIAVYRKKPEYGPASVVIEDYEAKEIERLYMVESGSSLLLKGNQVDPI